MEPLFDRLSSFLDLLERHPAVSVVERSSAPPRPLDPAVAAKLDADARAFFERTSELTFWWFQQSERAYAEPADYNPGAMGGYIRLVQPTTLDPEGLVFDRCAEGVACFEDSYVAFRSTEGLEIFAGFAAYLRQAAHSAFALSWQLPAKLDSYGLEDSNTRTARQLLLGQGDRALADPVDAEGLRPYEKPATDPEGRVAALVARGASAEAARSLVEWLADDTALLLG